MDFKLDLGDLKISRQEEDYYDGTSFYDLELISLEDTLSLIVKRTLETPLGYIKLYLNQDNQLQEIDGDYGNPVYRKLSEAITPSLLLEIKKDIENSLNKLSNIPQISINNISITDYSTNTINIIVTYTLSGLVTSLPISIQI